MRSGACDRARAGRGGLRSGSGDEPQGGQAPDYQRALAGAPPALASLYRQANRLLPGGLDAFDARLTGLRGHPVVVNKWASWCGPCREEFPWFQDLSARLGKRVAFLGVDSNDSSAAARTFLGEFPVPYPELQRPRSGDRQVDPGRGRLPGHRLLRPRGQARLHEAGPVPERGRARRGHQALRAVGPRPTRRRAPGHGAEAHN